MGGGFIGQAVAGFDDGRSTLLLTDRAAAVPWTCDLAPRSGADYRDLIDGSTTVVLASGPSVPDEVEHAPHLVVGPFEEAVHVLAAAADRPGCRVLFVSSGGAVYGEPATSRVPEEAPTRPLTAYGAGKVAIETQIRYFAAHRGVDATVLRCGNVYGARQVPGRGQGIVASILDAAARRVPFTLYGDGSIERDFIYIDDVARIVTELADVPSVPRVLNVGSGEATSMRTVIDLCAEATGAPVDVGYAPARCRDVRRICLDVSALAAVVRPASVSLPDGIRRAWDHLVAAAG